MTWYPPDSSPDPTLEVVVARLGQLRAVDWDDLAPLSGLPEPLRPEVITGPPPAAPAVPAGDRPSRRRPARRRRATVHPIRVQAVLAALAAVAVLAGLVLAGTFAGTTSGPERSGVPAGPGTWRLAAFIAGAPWEVGAVPAGGSSSAVVSCSTSRTCLAAGTGTPGGAAVEATTDGGATWRSTGLPTGVSLTSGLTCPAAGQCLAGARLGAGAPGTASAGSTSAVVATADGGATWSVRVLPPGVTVLEDLSCTSPTRCVGAGMGPAGAGSPTGTPLGVVTADGGRSWTVSALPGPFAPAAVSGLSCAGATTCVIAGVTDLQAPPGGPHGAPGAALWSADGGRHWALASIPPGVSTVTGVSCPTADRCTAVARGSTAPTPSAVGPSITLSSADGGRSWTVAGAPAPFPTSLRSVWCPTAADCWASGARIGAQAGSGPAGLIVATTNGGATWSVQPLPAAGTRPTPATGIVGLDIQFVSSVSCPASGTCVALGGQGSLAGPTERQVALRLGGP